MKSTKRAFINSVIVLALCISVLIGTTFAWFSDNISSKKNIITSGNINVEMYWTDDLQSGVWYNVEDDDHNTLFGYDNWEPGYTEVRYIKIVNAGSLAFNYKLALTPEGSVGKLAEVINVFVADEGVEFNDRSDLNNLNCLGLLNNVMNGRSTANGTLLAANQQSPLHESGETIVTLAMTMITTAGNEYQNETIGDGFTITAIATQAPFEEDSFGSDYDGEAEYPAIIRPGKLTTAVDTVDGKVSLVQNLREGAEQSAYDQPVFLRLAMAFGTENHSISGSEEDLKNFNKYIVDYIHIYQHKGDKLYTKNGSGWNVTVID